MVCITLSKTVSRSGLYGRGFFVIIFILGRRLSYMWAPLHSLHGVFTHYSPVRLFHPRPLGPWLSFLRATQKPAPVDSLYSTRIALVERGAAGPMI